MKRAFFKFICLCLYLSIYSAIHPCVWFVCVYTVYTVCIYTVYVDTQKCMYECTKRSTDEINLYTSKAASKMSSGSEYIHKHVLFWFHFYVCTGTVYVSLYKHTWLWLSADLKQTLCRGLKHARTYTYANTQSDPLSWAELDQPKADHPAFWTWIYGRNMQTWTDMQIHISAEQGHGP